MSNTKDTPMDYKQFEGHTETPYFNLHQNEYGKKWLFYSPGSDGKYNCWEPINDTFYAEFEKLQTSSKENIQLREMYVNTHAKLRDLEKEFSDTKANLHRAYKGLENHKELKLELQKQKELNVELVKAAEEAMKHLRAFKEVSGLPTDDVESQNAYRNLKAAIKSARL